MKLDAGQNWNVRSLGQHDVNAPLRVASAQANAARAEGAMYEKFGNTAKVVLDDMAERETRQQESDTSFKRTQNVVAFEEDNNKEYYTSAEVPKDINIPQHYRDDDRIPAYLVKGKKWMADSNMNISDLAQGIDNPRTREEWIKKQTVLAQNQYLKYAENAQKEQVRATRETAGQQIDVLKQQGEWEAAVAVAENFEGTDTEREKLVRSVKTEQEYSAYLDAQQDGNLRTMQEQIDFLDLDNAGYDGYLSEKQRVAMTKDLQARSKSVIAQANAATAKASANEIAQLEIAIYRGESGGSQSAIDALYDDGNGGMTPAKYVQLNKMLTSRNEAGLKKQKLVADTAVKFQSGKIFTAGDQSGLDALTESIGIDMNTPEGVETITHIAARTKMMPTMLKDHINAHVNSDNARVIQNLVELTEGLRKNAPDAYHSLKEKDRQALTQYQQAAEAGSDITPELIKTVKQSLHMDETTRDIRQQQYRTFIKDTPMTELANRIIDQVWDTKLLGLQPKASSELIRDVTTLFRTNLMSNGDTDAAIRLTQEGLASPSYGYGITSVKGDPRVMKMAPESEPGMEGKSKWMDADMDKMVTDAGLDPNKYTFLADSGTVKDSKDGKNRSYRIIDKFTQQSPQLYDADGKPYLLRYDPKTRYVTQQTIKADEYQRNRKEFDKSKEQFNKEIPKPRENPMASGEHGDWFTEGVKDFFN